MALARILPSGCVHNHLRQNLFLDQVGPPTAEYHSYLGVEPNTDPPLTNPTMVALYEANVRRALGDWPGKLLMSFFLTDEMTATTVRNMPPSVKFAKLFPRGVTTNSSKGVSDITKFDEVFCAMIERDLILQVHAAEPGEGRFTEEEEYIGELEWLLARYPDLRVDVQHISTKGMLDFVQTYPGDNLHGQVTVHHLFLTAEDVVGNNHNYCLPVARYLEDRDELRIAITSPGNNRIGYGRDTAPHPIELKRLEKPRAGIFMPGKLALCLAASVFDACGRLGNLGQWLHLNDQYYGVENDDSGGGMLEFVRESWTVPDEYGGAVPFMAGQEVPINVYQVS